MTETAPTAKNQERTASRLRPVDALRGLIIIFMALDHASYFIAQRHSSGEYWGGPFPAYDDPLAFLTRLVTHFSAPGFFLLMGVGMALFNAKRRSHGWSLWAVRAHFLIRGLILVSLQLLIVNRAWGWGPEPFPTVYIGVLIALGGTMILGGLFTGLPAWGLAISSLILLIGTEWLHPAPDRWGLLNNDLPNLLLMRPGGTGSLWSNYPILPWLELVLFGMLLGVWMRGDAGKAYRRSGYLGVIFLALMFILRDLDGFGNIRPSAGGSWIDFFNMVKYPPSMTFTLFTAGVNLLLLYALSRLERARPRMLSWLAVFGRAPLFVYVLHLFLYLLLGRIFTPQGTEFVPMYGFWLLGLLLLYPLASWYGHWKTSQPPSSPAHFF